MIRADLAVVGIAELATPEGRSARTGPAMGRLKILSDAAVACRDGLIVFVGTEREFRDEVELQPGGRTVDACAGTVLPGFVDAHTHLAFAGWRESEFNERLRGATYSEIAARGGGILSTVASTRAASVEVLSALIRERLGAMLRLGTTTAEVKSGYGLTVDDEIKQLEAVRFASVEHPVKIVPTFLGAHTVPPEYRQSRQEYVEIVALRMIPQVARQGLARYADVFVDPHAFSLTEARQVLEAAREHDLGVRVHADQLSDGGAAGLAAELGAASADHLEFASDQGLEAMARAGTSGILLPAATFFLMMERRPPGRRLVEAGIPVVVATDFNPGSCPTESMPAAMWFATLWGGLDVDETITAVTLNAAHSLGMAETTGSVETGKSADFVVHAVPNRYHLVYRFGVPRVRTVVAGGRVVVEDGQLAPGV
jgi:imidazolonepropionase